MKYAFFAKKDAIYALRRDPLMHWAAQKLKGCRLFVRMILYFLSGPHVGEG
jgi:hypothetical protein